jgi:hypothetical protein
VAGDWVFLPEHELAQLKLPWTLQHSVRGLALVRIDVAGATPQAPVPHKPGG